jgi:hypothetical protein
MVILDRELTVNTRHRALVFKERQKQVLSPDRIEIDESGPCSIDDSNRIHALLCFVSGKLAGKDVKDIRS